MGSLFACNAPASQTDAGTDASDIAADVVRIDIQGGSDIPDVPDVPPHIRCEVSGCAAGTTCCAGDGYCYDATTCIACCAVADAGSPCQSNGECAANEYCEGPPCRLNGNCAPRPATCAADPAPVCGCDEVTYANACTAALMGQSVRTLGVCPLRDAGPGPCNADSDCYGGQFCCVATHACYPWTCPACCSPDRACADNAGCAANEFCNVCAADTHDAATGWCLRRPASCGTEAFPVCGCDGVTYPNECSANAAGQRVNTLGACP